MAVQYRPAAYGSPGTVGKGQEIFLFDFGVGRASYRRHAALLITWI